MCYYFAVEVSRYRTILRPRLRFRGRFGFIKNVPHLYLVLTVHMPTHHNLSHIRVSLYNHDYAEYVLSHEELYASEIIRLKSMLDLYDKVKTIFHLQ